MFLSKSTLQKRKYVIAFLLMFIVLTPYAWGNNYDHSVKNKFNHLKVRANKTKLPAPFIDSPMDSEVYAPGIAAILQTQTLTYNNNTPGCTYIEFRILVYNKSDNNESLENIDISMGTEITISFKDGDDNNNGQLDVGEQWTYQGKRIILKSEIENGMAEDQAAVKADVVGQPGVVVSDLSHGTLQNFDAPTKTFLDDCGTGISLLLTGVTTGPLGNGDPGCSGVELTYELHHTSDVPGETFESIVLNDSHQGNIIAPDSGDDINFGHLDPGEVWIYKVAYVPTAEEYLAGTMLVQGYVEGVSALDTNIMVSDLSDYVSLDEDRKTAIDLSTCVPKISLIKKGVTINGLGEEGGCSFIQYSFSVTNQSGQDQVLSNISLADINNPGLFIQGPNGDINNDGLMDPGETWDYTANYQITADDINAGSVENQARVGAELLGPVNITLEDFSDYESTDEDRPTVVDLSACSPRISLIKKGVAKNGFGEDGGCSFVEYNFVVTNESGPDLTLGNITLTDLNIPNDAIVGPDGDTNNDGLMDPGESWSYTAIYQLTADDINAEQVENQAHVKAKLLSTDIDVEDYSDYESIDEDRPTVVPLVNCARMGLIKTGVLNEDCTSINYTFTLTNESGDDQILENVVLNDLSLPLVIEGPEGDANNNTRLDIDETWTYTATYALTQADIDAGQVDNQALVSANVLGLPDLMIEDLSDDNSIDENDITSIDVSSCQISSPSIGLIKSGVLADVNTDGCDESIRYTFTVTNTGDVDLDQVTVDDPLLGGVLAGPVAGSDEGDDGILSIGESWTYEALYAFTQQDIDNGNVANSATVTAQLLGTDTEVQDLSDDNSLLEDDPTNTTVPNDACLNGSAGIGLIKTGTLTDVNTDGCDESIRYTFTVTNTGDVDLDQVTVDDPLLGGVLAGPVAGSDEGNDGILSIGESWTYEALYAFTQQDIDNGNVANSATVTAQLLGTDTEVQDLSDDDSLQEDNPTNTTIPNDACINGSAGIGLIKSGALIDVNTDGCNESIRYTFTVTNTGDVDLDQIIVDDPLLGGSLAGPVPESDEGEDGILSIGESWTYEALYELEQPDIDNGNVVNSATVSAQMLGTDTEVQDQSDNDSLLEDDPTNTVVPNDACTTGSAGIGLIKTGALVDVNTDGCDESIQYTFTVTNTGDVDLDEVTVNDPLLGGILAGPVAGSDDGDDGILSIGESWIYVALYEIIQQDIDNGNVVNSATVSAQLLGTDTELQDLSDDNSLLEDDPTNTSVPNDACINGSAGIGLIKTGTLADVNTDGCDESIQYTFTVTNTGDVDLDEVTVNDPLLGGALAGPVPESDDGDDGILSVGESWTYEALYEIIQQDIDNGNVMNSATASAQMLGTDTEVQDLSDDNSLLEDDPTNTVVPNEACTTGSAGIGLIKTGALVDVNTDGCDESIQYTFTVTNTGDVDLDEVTVNDPLLGGALAGPVPESDDGDDGILSIGESWTYEALYELEQQDIDNGNVVNSATVSAQLLGTDTEVQDLSDDNSLLEDDPTNTLVPNDACTNGSAGIGLIKTGTLTDVNTDGCDESIQYTFTVTNTGDVDLDEVTVNDPLLGGALAGPVADSDDGDDGILSIGESWTYEALYGLEQPDIDNGNVVNSATVSAQMLGTDTEVQDLSDNDSLLEDDPTNTVVPNEACTTGSAGIGLIKTGILADVNTDGCNENIRYTFTVTNTGDADLDEVTVNDPLLGGVLAGPVADSDEGNDGILSIGESWTYEALYAFTQQDIDNGSVVNSATVTAQLLGTDTEVQDLSDDDSLLEDDPTNTTVPNDACTDGSAGIGLIKTGVLADVNTDGCDESIRYTFTVTNTGDVDLDQVTVDDPLLGGVLAGPVAGSDEGNDGILSIGESWTYEALYEIIQQDIDNGNVANSATVTAQLLGTDTEVQDLSDDDSLQEDNPTNTTVPNDACINGSAGIGLIKSGALIDVNTDGCNESIRYTFTVTNTGDVDLDQIIVDDPLLGGSLAGPVAGSDEGNDGILSIGESWTYEALYEIIQQDIDNGNVVNSATVTAKLLGTDTEVQDLSDDDSLQEDNPTNTTIPNDACINGSAGIGLIKTGVLADVNTDGCDESIRYTFTVTNTGDVDLDQVTVNDPLLGGVLAGPVAGSDEGDDGILSIGESWTYEALYEIIQQDIDNGSVVNSATVTAQLLGTDTEVQDQSDNNSLLENDPTTVIIVNDACTTGGAGIGLIKEGELFDANYDGCDDSIRYTFTVTNGGYVDLEEIKLTDDLLGGTITGPLLGNDINEDGVLSVGESWVYEDTYPLAQEDIDEGLVTNQATVMAKIKGMEVQIMDLSDDNSILENQQTITFVPNYSCSGGVPDPDFQIFTGITPDGDDINDYFRINSIENYPDNVLKIFNRWGALVYQAEGYGLDGNYFTGISQGKATIQQKRELPSGTYFYTLSFTGQNPGKENYSGYLYINRD
ncbi:MAG: gliding motility-associated C-terminal domain-containing protein [Muricauda sp.]|nr:gliding motility-associated C-terminal domain-containing protein [Allomuricauda sp.]MBA4743845.1 gliding motility-associated C-terminal domain-containing protein [Allomuricauda sp.]